MNLVPQQSRLENIQHLLMVLVVGTKRLVLENMPPIPMTVALLGEQ
jgi:hypothetical protein